MSPSGLAPDRRDMVQAVCAAHPETFQGPIEQSDARRLALLPTIINALNVTDGGAWGLLVKTDQGNKIPADVIVWAPSREHFDVMTDTGAVWIPKGVLGNPAWQWRAVNPIDVPLPPPAPPDVVPLLGAMSRALVDVLKETAILREQVTALLQLSAQASPVYRGKVYGVSIVLYPEPPAPPTKA